MFVGGEGVADVEEQVLSSKMILDSEMNLDLEKLSPSPAIIEGGRQKKMMDYSFSRPLTSPPDKFEIEVPFKTARGFGHWLYHKSLLMSNPNWYTVMHMKFFRYTQNLQIIQLIRFGKTFQNEDRLFYLQGLHIIAVTIKQKLAIKKIFDQEFDKLVVKMKTQKEKALARSISARGAVALNA